jgi:hypothetical protein
MVSNLHAQDYVKVFGLDKILPSVRSWDGDVVRVPLSALMSDEFVLEKEISEDVLVEVKFEHAISGQVIDKFDLLALPGFDYQSYLSAVFCLGEKKFDYVIHLRLGDNYAYSLGNGMVLDSGRRRIVHESELGSELIASQWSIADVLETSSRLNAQGAEYCIHCDGIESVVKHIRWHKDPAYDEFRHLLLPAVENFFKSFMDRCGNLPNVYIGEADVRRSVQDLLWSRSLIYSGGGFMRSINRLWNVPPVPSESIKSFLSRGLSADEGLAMGDASILNSIS